MKTHTHRATARRLVSVAPALLVMSGGLLLPGPTAAAAEPRQDVASSSVADPSAPDARWGPWLGCWQLLDERVRGQNLSGPSAIRSRRADDTGRTTDVLVCVTPAGARSAVTLSTMTGGRTLLEQTVVADGSRRPVTETGCQGWEEANWSRSGQRLFARAELTCEGQPPRTLSGITMLAPTGAWIEVQVIAMSGQESIRVRRYRRAAPGVGPDARAVPPAALAALPVPSLAEAPLTVDDVTEALANVSPRAVEAALIETQATFALSGKRLIELDAAGVPDEIIDLMVALSYPRHFVVERPSSADAWGLAGLPAWLGPWAAWSIDDPFYWPYDYAPFGYSYWGRTDAFYYGRGGFVRVDEPTTGAVEERGRVVDGRGYTRVRPREAESNPTAGGYGGVSAGSGAAGGAGTEGVSSQGYSSGGGDTGRTAQPRPPG